MADPRPILLAALLMGSAGAAAAGTTSSPDRAQRYTVDTAQVSMEELHRGAAAGSGEILRLDDHVGFAVLELADPDEFEAETGVEPRPDPQAQILVETPVAEIPIDTYLAAQWGPLELNGPQAWQVTDDDPDVTVAVIDSGIDLDHPDFQSTAVVEGHDYIEGDETPNDELGHGTHVAGIVSAARDNGRGVAGMSQTQLFVVRVIDADGSGFCSDIASAIQDAVEADVDVINLSLGCVSPLDALDAAVESAVENGTVVAASAGNSQQSAPEKCVAYPARKPQVTAVAATDPHLEAASYSCRGDAVELSAPGSYVLSTTLDGAYSFSSGTSMATPHVSATMALMLDQDPTLTPAEIRDTLNRTARDLGESGEDPAHGHGMVDPVAALTGLPVYVPADTEALDEEVGDPYGLACANPAGDAECSWTAASGTGNATTGTGGFASVSGTGDAEACGSWVGDGNIQILPTCAAASGTGNATGSPVAVSGTGDARADCIAASGTGQAESDCYLLGLELAVSGCETADTWTGSRALCTGSE